MCSLLLLFDAPAIAADDLAALVLDRTAIEQVYHTHRTGSSLPFEQALPRSMIEQLVRLDLKKETVLNKTYDFEVTSAMVENEVRRINSSSRAPEVLSEIKQALGGDPKRFARSMARPIVVERELRRRFENDNKLHASERGTAEKVREDLRAKKTVAEMRDVTWQLSPRPGNGISETSIPPPQTKGAAKSGTYSVDATAQVAQVLNPQSAMRDRKFYFGDLDPELQKALQAQLKKSGDVSAVIETPTAFLVFVAKEKTKDTLSAASITIPKRSYDEWLAHQVD
jgi:DnaJ-domain-containing protein 1